MTLYAVRFWAALCICASVLSILSRAEPLGRRSSISGLVHNNAGSPVADASVFIYSASPKIGRGQSCPTCYPDCRKRADCDSEGRFELQDVDPKLVFKLLVISSNTQPQFVPGVNPSQAGLRVKTIARAASALPHRTLRGRVLDATGSPVARALISFEMFIGRDANCGGSCDGVDPAAISGEDGRFALIAQTQFERMRITVEKPGFALSRFFDLEPDQEHELRLTDGATVTGRISHAGKAAANIPVGLVSADRAESFIKDIQTLTDSEGRFTFHNVMAYQMYYVYSLLNSSNLTCPPKRVRVAAEGSKKDVGELTLAHGWTLSGHVILSDRGAIPANLRISLSRGAAWDSATVPVDPNGFFRFTGLPTESITLWLAVPGYHVSEKNRSFDRLNRVNLVGRVESDCAIEILVEPGPAQQPARRAAPGSVLQPKDEPLAGYQREAF